MSAIINRGENLVLERQVSVAQTKTQGGVRVAQKRGPTLYNLEVDVPSHRLNSAQYYSIEQEVITLEYGAETFESAGISGQIGGNLTSHRGLWSGSPTVATANQAGNTITLQTGPTGASVAGYVRAFDYIQFAGSTKVYQATADADSDSSGIVKVTLNSPLVASPALSSTVVFGGNVSFNFALMERPTTQYQPGEIIQYGTFMFEEVIEDKTRTTADQTNPPGTLSQQLFLPGTETSSTGSGSYSGWVISDGTNSENVPSEREIQFIGASGITPSYDLATNALTITGSTYSVSSPSDGVIRLTGSNETTDDITLAAGTNLSVATSGIAGSEVITLTPSLTPNLTTVETTGIATIGGNATVGGTLGVTGNTTITGDLTVNGTTTTINSTVKAIADKDLLLASNAATATSTTEDDNTAVTGGGLQLGDKRTAAEKTANDPVEPVESFTYDGTNWLASAPLKSEGLVVNNGATDVTIVESSGNIPQAATAQAAAEAAANDAVALAIALG